MIPVNEPILDGNEKKYLCECIDTKWISSEGPFVKRLEEGIAKVTQRKYAVAVANGSLALDLAVASLDLEPGSEVIVPTFTIISCVSAILRAKCRPVLVDCHPATWNLEAKSVEAAITTRTRAIMVVHIYGLPCEMDGIFNIAKKYKLKIIEDAAEQLGQYYKTTPCGNLGDISTLSFYPNKHITTGEGGMILTDDEKIAENAKSLRNLCFGPRRFYHEKIGWNARMSNLQAAVGVAQLEKLNENIKRKKMIGDYYNNNLQNIPGLTLPLRETSYARNIYWVFGIVMSEEMPWSSDEVIALFRKEGVECRPFFWPMHQQPVFRELRLGQPGQMPVSEWLAKKGFYVPSGLGLTFEDQKRVVEVVKGIFKNCKLTKNK